MAGETPELLEKYAELAVKVGLNLQKGQRLVVYSGPIGVPITAAPFVRALAAAAYRAGSPLVEVLWDDEELLLTRFKNAPRDSFDQYPEWAAQVMAEHARRGSALAAVTAATPGLLAEVDPEAVNTAQRTRLRLFQPFSELASRNATNWCVTGAATPGWAQKVFPDVAPEQALVRLWAAIFAACRVDEPDPAAAWEKHAHELSRRCEYLNGKQYRAFHYRGSGTDLTVGLPRGQRWAGGRVQSETGIPFIPNLPTEEVFTLADRLHAEGTVKASKPLPYAGAVIEDFQLTFAGGRVVDLQARQGEDLLRKLVETDEGAGRLGEVALVPNSCPVARAETLFYNPLYDENAASHLALGRAYRFNLSGGERMSDDEFEGAGGNRSAVHVDFMIGAGELDVDGVLEDGQSEAVMRSGEWAFGV